MSAICSMITGHFYAHRICSEKMVMKEEMLRSCIEKHDGGVYYTCIYPVISYDVWRAAVHTLTWYVGYLNDRLDTRRYAFVLTHNSCVLTVRMTMREYEKTEDRELFAHRANVEIQTVRDTFFQLAEGMVPSDLKQKIQRQMDDMAGEW